MLSLLIAISYSARSDHNAPTVRDTISECLHPVL